MEIEEAENRYRLGRLAVGELRPLAIAAISQGYAGPALYELADGGYGSWTEIGELFERALAEMGRAPLTAAEAAMRAARAIAVRIVSGAIDPYAGAREIWEELWADVGRPEALTPLVGLAAAYTYDDDAEQRRRYRADIIMAARALIDER